MHRPDPERDQWSVNKPEDACCTAVSAGYAPASAAIANGADVDAEGGHRDVVEFLLAIGTDVDARSQFAWTPLYKAASAGHKDVADLLVTKGADVGYKNSYGRTALHLAAFAGHRDVVVFLTANGADVNAENAYGKTPLHTAASAGHKDVV